MEGHGGGQGPAAVQVAAMQVPTAAEWEAEAHQATSPLKASTASDQNRKGGRHRVHAESSPQAGREAPGEALQASSPVPSLLRLGSQGPREWTRP